MSKSITGAERTEHGGRPQEDGLRKAGIEGLQHTAEYLLDEMRGAEASLICAIEALNDREKGETK